MMERGKVYIIPNENEILDGNFYREIPSSHVLAFQEFSDKHGLGYQFGVGDSNEAPLILADAGNLVVKTVDDAGLYAIYLPRIVTDNQNMWLYSQMLEIRNYTTVGGYSLENNGRIKTIDNLNEMLQEANKKNVEYSRNSYSRMYTKKRI